METEIMADRRQREGEETDVDLYPLLSIGWEKKQLATALLSLEMKSRVSQSRSSCKRAEPFDAPPEAAENGERSALSWRIPLSMLLLRIRQRHIPHPKQLLHRHLPSCVLVDLPDRLVARSDGDE
jgi:hypothetical protein